MAGLPSPVVAPEKAKEVSARAAARRTAELDWEALAADLETQGSARLPGLLRARECNALRKLHPERERFRSFVDLGQHRFGEGGDYRYFAAPLPALVQTLRERLYAGLAPIANAWWRRLGRTPAFPASLAAFTARCHGAGQTRPTPLLLRYDAGGTNYLHQDVYGEIAFPLQVAILLSRSAEDARRDGRPPDFEGGEFLLVEQRPRQQSRGEAFALRRGEAIVFANAERPVRGARGSYRAKVRHGVSRVRSGERLTLGIIFHDAN